MTVIAPQTDVYLLKVPLEIDNINQLTFANASTQHSYFNGLDKLGFDNFTYQRKDNVIRIPALIDDIIQYNYVMYRNDAYTDKWFYAYIDRMEYLNDQVTAVYISTDTWQTWQFDLTFKPVFIEREHVNDDTIGSNTVPESLETGEYEIVDLRNIPLWETNSPSTDWLPCFCVTKFPSGASGLVNGRVASDSGSIGGVFSSLKFFAVGTQTAAQAIINAYDADTTVTSDAIINIYMIPSCCVNMLSSGASTINGYPLYPIYNYYDVDSEKTQEPNKLAENYTPVNNKLFTFPYSYFYISNNSGEEVSFRYEDFPEETVDGNKARTITFVRSIVPSTSLSAKLYFPNYKSYSSTVDYGTKMYNYGINFGKVPVCAWTTDYYTNWLTQNGVNMQMQIASTALGAVTGTISGGITSGATGAAAGAIGGVTSLASTIMSQIGQKHAAEVVPPQAQGDVNTGDFLYCYKRNSMSLYKMSIRPEYARIIDKFFSVFGYQVNRVKMPNITGRRNWNYVKTHGCYIDADIPQEDLQQIKDMFNNGVTLWHNPDNFGNYNANNDII